jgi:hypothetical protein
MALRVSIHLRGAKGHVVVVELPTGRPIGAILAANVPNDKGPSRLAIRLQALSNVQSLSYLALGAVAHRGRIQGPSDASKRSASASLILGPLLMAETVFRKVNDPSSLLPHQIKRCSFARHDAFDRAAVASALSASAVSVPVFTSVMAHSE